MKRYTSMDYTDPALPESETGEWVKYEDARIAVADALDKHRHLMDHYMALKSHVANLESRIALIDKRLEDECPFDWGNHRIVITYLSPINNDT